MSQMSRSNQWFVPGDGIAREVITADIQRYLGPDALVRPGVGTGEHEGRNGYWITAYRTLTTQMIQDLKMDSQRWQQEAGRVAYQDSRTHAARQHWGPSAVSAPTEYPQTREPAAPRSGYPSQPQYSPSEHNSYTQTPSPYTTTPSTQHSAYATTPSTQHSAYTTTPASQYSSQQPGYSVPPASQQPRTTHPDPYAYSQRDPTYSSQQYYNTQSAQESSRQSTNPPPPTYYTTPSSQQAAPGYYIASDGRQYPLSAQPQPPQPNTGRSRRTGA